VESGWERLQYRYFESAKRAARVSLYSQRRWPNSTPSCITDLRQRFLRRLSQAWHCRLSARALQIARAVATDRRYDDIVVADRSCTARRSAAGALRRQCQACESRSESFPQNSVIHEGCRIGPPTLTVIAKLSRARFADLKVPYLQALPADSTQH